MKILPTKDRFHKKNYLVKFTMLFSLLTSLSFADDSNKENQDTKASPQDQADSKKGSPFNQRKPRCSYRKGDLYYKEYGDAMHRYRLPSELTPAQWRTVMLFHRVRIPLTADEYCSLVDFFNITEEDKKADACESCPIPGMSDSDSQNENSSSPSAKAPTESKLSDLQNQIQELNMRPSDEFFADSNFVLKGSTFMEFYALEDNNNSFQAGLNPIFLWRWKDRILFELELEMDLLGMDFTIDVEYVDLNYIMNEFITIRAGKFLLPLGFWKEKMHPEWINKLPTNPLPYNPEADTVIPVSELGVEVRGAIPIWNNPWNENMPMTMNYHAWIGNGPTQADDGSISFNDNYTDNNNNKAVGTKFGFYLWPYREIGISGMYGQWNNNAHGGEVFSKRKQYFAAIVAELDWHFGAYFRFCGEWMWTRYGAALDPDLKIFHHVVFTRAAWAQLSSTFGMFKFPYSENFEAIVRYGWVGSTIKTNSRRQWSFGLDYYLTGSMVVKAGYDLNMGRGIFSKDLFTIQWAYGY